MMKRIMLIGILFLFTGCGGDVAVRNGGRGFVPKIPLPHKITLAEFDKIEQAWIVGKAPKAIVNKIQGNVGKLHLRVRQLEASIEKYNNYAEINNALVRQELGLPSNPLVEKEDK